MMSMQQEAEIHALRKQCAGLNEQIGVFLRRIKELEAQLKEARTK